MVAMPCSAPCDRVFRRRVVVDPETFDAVQPLLDKIAELAEKQLESEELRRMIAEPKKFMGKAKVASVNIVVDVFDEDRECSLPLLTSGLSVFPDKEAFRTWSDSTPQRYVDVHGGHLRLPHDFPSL